MSRVRTGTGTAAQVSGDAGLSAVPARRVDP